MNQAHVICCNDSVEHVYIGDETDAKILCGQMREAKFERIKDNVQTFGKETAYEAYRQRYYWHLHTVGLTLAEGGLT